MTVRLAWLGNTEFDFEAMRPQWKPQVATYRDLMASWALGAPSVKVSEVLAGIAGVVPGRSEEGIADLVHDELFGNRVVDWPAAAALACAWTMEERPCRGELLDDQVPGALLASEGHPQGSAVLTRNSEEVRDPGAKTAAPWTGGLR